MMTKDDYKAIAESLSNETLVAYLERYAVHKFRHDAGDVIDILEVIRAEILRRMGEGNGKNS